MQASFRAYAEGFPGVSLWSTFVNDVCPDLDVTIIPTYWRQSLHVVPYTPYGNPVVTVYDDEIHTAGLPAVDPAPIGGTRIVIRGGERVDDDPSSFSECSEEPNDEKITEVLYLAQATSDVPGKIVPLAVPTWLTNAKTHETKLDPPLSEQNQNGSMVSPDDSQPEFTTPSMGGGGDGPPTAAYVDACYDYAKAAFIGMYRENSEVSLITPLMLKSESSGWPDKFVVPGCVFSIQIRADEAGGKLFMDTYVTEIVHVIDAGSADAHTEILGSYCRAGKDELVKSGTPNPIYSSITKEPA